MYGDPDCSLKKLQIFYFTQLWTSLLSREMRLVSFPSHSEFGAILMGTDLPFGCHSCLRCQDNEDEEWLAI